MRTISIRIPSVLRHHTGGQRAVEASGATVGEVLEVLFAAYPTLRAALIPSTGDLFASTNVFLNDEDVTALGGLAAPVKPGDSLTILPAMAGGCGVRRLAAALPSGTLLSRTRRAAGVQDPYPRPLSAAGAGERLPRRGEPRLAKAGASSRTPQRARLRPAPARCP